MRRIGKKHIFYITSFLDKERTDESYERREYFSSFRKLKKFVKRNTGAIYYDKKEKSYYRYEECDKDSIKIQYKNFDDWFEAVILKGQSLSGLFPYGCYKIEINKKDEYIGYKH